jgi:hypothetical protein
MRDGVSTSEWEWIQRVVDGASFTDAVGSHITRQRIRESEALTLLDNAAVRARLVKGLLMAGKADRAQEVLAYAATVASLKALEEGSEKTALAILGTKAPAKPRAGMLPSPPEARELGDDARKPNGHLVAKAKRVNAHGGTGQSSVESEGDSEGQDDGESSS